MAMKGLGWRAAALVYVWTIGLIISLFIILAASLYAVVDIVNAAVGNTTFWKEFKLFMAISSLLTWWSELHRYAFLGDGPGFDPTPDVDW